MDVLTSFSTSAWGATFSPEIQTTAISDLEHGKILLFPQLPFSLTEEEALFLSPAIIHPSAKNISFHLAKDTLKGARLSAFDTADLKAMMKRFALYAQQLIHHLLPHYTPALIVGRTSFRPVEISGRVSSYRKDDTRLHVDAFPATPTQGQRLLRVFCNIHPGTQPRVWRTGESFEEVAQQFLPHIRRPFPGSAQLLKTLRITKGLRTPYDHVMLQIHDRMKADLHYQKTARQHQIDFMPGHTWIVQTDQVSHAALSGQHLLEQTFYLPAHAMKTPALSPLKILERLLKRDLV